MLKFALFVTYTIAIGAMILLTYERSESKQLQDNLRQQLEQARDRCEPKVGDSPLLFSVQREGELKCVYNFRRPLPKVSQKRYEEILHGTKTFRRKDNDNK